MRFTHPLFHHFNLGVILVADFLFYDWETRGPDLTVMGALNYVLDERTRIMLLTYSFDKGATKTWVPDLSDELSADAWAMVTGMVDSHTDIPPEIIEHVENGGLTVAWNAAFDRHVWQQIATPDLGFPELKITQTLDAMAQAQASNLPGKLDMAGRALRLGGKTQGGSAVMKKFANLDIPMPDEFDDWNLYLEYGVQDTDLMVEVWYVTRPLALEEWEDYWVSERINDRGIGVDLAVCEGAIQYREEEAVYTAAECMRLTNGQIAKPTLTQKINAWVYEWLPESLSEFMVAKRDEETHEVTNLTLGRKVIERILSEIELMETPPADNVVQFLELMEFGRSSSAIKFEKMRNQAVDGRLCSSYVCNGAGQTGRFSSRGIQMHNLPRDAMEEELELLEMVADKAPIEAIRKYGPISKTLSRLIRPTLIADTGKVFVWGDWSAIEARVLPWLANSRSADRAVLQPFRDGDDLYILNAADIFNVSAEDLYGGAEAGDKEAGAMRQAGKVAVLALGFGGSVGAYKAMARGYGMAVTNDEGKTIVDGWRDRNQWARVYWKKLEDAAFSAMQNPGTYFTAGRVSYVFEKDLLAGSLLCFLPDGRPLMYPMARFEMLETSWGEKKKTITYHNGMGRNSMWYGKFAENITQGYAASILRRALKNIEISDFDFPVVAHTHDEIIGEVPEEREQVALDWLLEVMEDNPPGTEDLPLNAGMTSDTYYHK